MFLTIVKTLAERRNQLTSYALRYLPKEILEGIHVTGNTTPDLEAMNIVTRLELLGHYIDYEHYLLDGKSVYNREISDKRALDLLYNAGFNNLGGPMLGRSTLLQYLFGSDPPVRNHIRVNLEVSTWLHHKGVSLASLVHFERYSDICVPVIGKMSAWIGRALGKYHYRFHCFHSAIRALLIALDPQYAACTDSCRCFCALIGCTPFVHIVKSMLAELP